MTVHSKVYGRRRFSYNSEKIIAVSNAISEHLVNEFNIYKNKITTIPNSINYDEVKITKGREILFDELKLKVGTKIIGYIGRIDIKEKGIDVLLNAFNKVNHDSLILLLIGNGKDENFISEFVKNCKHRIIVLPETKNVFNYYNLMDIFILPSKTEPFGIVLLEAGLMKLPVIASNVDGIPEIIENNVNGLLFESENLEELAEKIEFLLDNNAIGRRLGETLYDKVIENYTTEKNIKKIEELYHKFHNS